MAAFGLCSSHMKHATRNNLQHSSTAPSASRAQRTLHSTERLSDSFRTASKVCYPKLARKTEVSGIAEPAPHTWSRGPLSVRSTATTDRQRTKTVAATEPRTSPPMVSTSGSSRVTERPAKSGQAPSYGFQRNFEEIYEMGKEIGKGGTSTVYEARHLSCDLYDWAVKVIPKVQDGAVGNLRGPEELKKATITEVEVLKRLRGTLSVIHFQEAFEDDDNVYLVMERCRGGELYHKIGTVPYTEAEVANIMRAVLKTLCQCHKANIIHRDIKPGNFLLQDDDTVHTVPVYKCIDFGLATYYDGENTAHSDTMSGTPWYLAPEMLSSKVSPASDNWAAGVMMYQLLCGRFPFNDHRNPLKPYLSKVCGSILRDPLEFKGAYWDQISDQAKDLISKLLVRDPSERLTAKAALQHPWLRAEGEPGLGRRKRRIKDKIVQRLQRFSSQPIFHQTVIQMLTQQLQASQGADPGPAAEWEAPDQGSVGELTSMLRGADQLFGKLDDDDNNLISFSNLHSKLTSDNTTKYELSQLETKQLIPPHYPHTGQISRLEFVAAFLDLFELQAAMSPEQFTALARKVFDRLDEDADGSLQAEEVARWVANQCSPDDLPAAVRDAFRNAGVLKPKKKPSIIAGLDKIRDGQNGNDDPLSGASGIDFETFMKALVPSRSQQCMGNGASEPAYAGLEVEDFDDDDLLYDDRLILCSVDDKISDDFI